MIDTNDASKSQGCCKDCEHALFNPILGEYKCFINYTYIFDPIHTCCKDFIKGKDELKMSKEGEDYEQ